MDGDEPINGASVALSSEPAPDETVAEPSPPAAAPSESKQEPDGQRNPWRRVLAVAVVVVATFAVVLLWARPAHEPVAPAARPPAVTTSLNPTDLAFLNLMISLDASALPL